MVANMVERLLSVPEAAQRLPALAGSRLRVGTMCSGTDSPILAMNAIAKALEGRQGGFEVQHCFSCEIDKDKQLFLRKNFAFDALFNDVCELGDETAHDELSGQRVAVPTGLDIIIAGFSCKDLSGMNRFRKNLEEMGTSGTTLQGCLDYILRHRPRIAIFENVKNIALLDSATGLRPVDLVMEALKRLGYRAGWKFLNTRNYYLPQSRARVWMWGYRIGDAPDPKYRPVVSELAAELVHRDTAQQPASDAASAALNDKVSRTLEHLQRDAVIHFDDLILPDDDPHVRQDIEKRTGRDTNKVSISEKAKLTWDVKHKMHRDSLRNRYSKPYTSYRGAPWLRTLNEREKQLCDINFQEVYEARGIDARQVPMVWELSQSAGRVPGTKTAETQMHCTPCIVPGSLWHTTRRRFLLGREKLRFQGIFEEDLKDLDCVPESVLGDLAGNAFSATVCAANLLAALIFAEP
jgi:site-specific DNA-cytosine methylase